MSHPLQPLLHDATVALAAPTQTWSGRDGQMIGGIHGIYHSDSRVFSTRSLRVGGAVPEHISTASVSASDVVFVALARNVDDAAADPRVQVETLRQVSAGRVAESVTIRSTLKEPLSTMVELRLSADFGDMQVVKSGLGAGGNAQSMTANPGGAGTLALAHGTVTADLAADGADIAVDPATGTITLSWAVEVPAKSQATVHWAADLADTAAVVAGAADFPEWQGAGVESGDSRISRWVERALEDLGALRMCTTARPAEAFLAAGAPWFFTLFGRDSLISARMLLPLGTDLAGSTLRVLAGLQGTGTDNDTAEQPGKIMHELRPKELTIPGEGVTLPPLYYGTVDATALWVTLLVDAWRWGLPDDEVRELLPHMLAALDWIRTDGDSDGDGFLEYADLTGHGLANQGWKDSGDSVQWRDGSLAEGPIALCEVQAYAFEAASGAAELMDHFGLAGGDEWRHWAAGLATRFREQFWIADADGAYPAIALDAHKRPVDTVTSNIGHLLGTGLLNVEEEALVAARLVSPELNSGFGLRTMSTDSAGYWPLSYHGGSVWTHDTAIAIQGLTRAGFPAEAANLSRGLLAAAEAFDYRMPELHSGDSAADARTPAPYPAACRPQAWSAASAIAVVASALDMRPDRNTGTVETSPVSALGSLSVSGIRIGGVAVGTVRAG
ncbi:amylo-alpha-1,6-glucosidase [Arthrobacter sp. ERGS1:01]|uniref:glycogen debranching N-terminal domain-containing protein n=1 Tax=Arthrobacter sp. ERGS1:01 TaxID=1704044 RepID=UPI0006B54616|nr:glycogen debranching N-terminal domain-containing protein [Arthrobacter sp. ERGS1:01]ALE06761.1 amylo-alpha-1,6-glucosidase [Arthrobacter sp. ERGS1:01]